MRANGCELIFVVLALSGCVTTPEKYGASKISYAQWKLERKEYPKQIDQMLSSVKAAFDGNPKLFDNCFTGDDGKRIKGKGLLNFNLNLSSGKLTLDDFASPEPLAGLRHENFGRCADMILANLQIAPNPSYNIHFTYYNMLKIIWPSWENSMSEGRTEIKPDGFHIGNSAVCMKTRRRFHAVSPWEVWKQGSQYFSDNVRKIEEKDILLCSDRDSSQALLFDEKVIRQQYPDESNVIDDVF